MSINYSPAQIGDALGQLEIARQQFMDGAEGIQALYKELEALSSGTSITAAVDAQNQAMNLRQQTSENIEQVKRAAQGSLERVQGDDARFTSILGG
ncbi:hypothetical protein GS896_25355 [Rhodococcus hoagii]|nr:hypothetical protein [Prescottella equi]MBM4574690.1 hypothetical protein [Prescottella equi]MBM4574902.1 hypothetical protein [Prescottella equi]MBM4654168.1 hypothetical protein [Prescottella equi]MBM4719640.1 hypothetical protein [Prescottella equi]